MYLYYAIFPAESSGNLYIGKALCASIKNIPMPNNMQVVQILPGICLLLDFFIGN
jgi:hypothetical protein